MDATNPVNGAATPVRGFNGDSSLPIDSAPLRVAPHDDGTASHRCAGLWEWLAVLPSRVASEVRQHVVDAVGCGARQVESFHGLKDRTRRNDSDASGQPRQQSAPDEIVTYLLGMDA
jgi:hypothetical protein